MAKPGTPFTGFPLGKSARQRRLNPKGIQGKGDFLSTYQTGSQRRTAAKNGNYTISPRVTPSAITYTSPNINAPTSIAPTASTQVAIPTSNDISFLPSFNPTSANDFTLANYGASSNPLPINDYLTGINTDSTTVNYLNNLGRTDVPFSYDPNKQAVIPNSAPSNPKPPTSTGDLLKGTGAILSGVGSLASAYNAYKQYQLGRDTFNHNKAAFNVNLANQAKVTNAQITDRERRRAAENSALAGNITRQQNVAQQNANPRLVSGILA